MKPHKHVELIKAWADGAEIEVLSDNEWHLCTTPIWDANWRYRIKPEPKPDVAFLFNAHNFDGDKTDLPRIVWVDELPANLRLIWDGVTGKIKSAEVIND